MKNSPPPLFWPPPNGLACQLVLFINGRSLGPRAQAHEQTRRYSHTHTLPLGCRPAVSCGRSLGPPPARRTGRAEGPADCLASCRLSCELWTVLRAADCLAPADCVQPRPVLWGRIAWQRWASILRAAEQVGGQRAGLPLAGWLAG